MPNIIPGLFGLNRSNRDFSNANSWGKNQFNSSFPAALCCYMHSKELKANYISITNGSFGIKELGIHKLFGMDPLSPDIYFAFESQFLGLQQFVDGNIPRTDLVIQNTSSKGVINTAFLEVKLTALPDNTTCDLNDSQYGSELVIRPDTIVYQAASIAQNNSNLLHSLPSISLSNINDWSDASQVIPYLPEIKTKIVQLITQEGIVQTPLLLQPVWKTSGKSPELENNCLDVFVWSDVGLAWYITQIANTEQPSSITRQTRTLIWLYKMLLEIHLHGKMSQEKIIDEMTYNTKNDKAFASSGNVTNPYMKCANLTTPRIKKEEIKNIILGGGQGLLSPERRFDAIIFNSPNLFLSE